MNKTMRSRVVGVTVDDHQVNIAQCLTGSALGWRREPENVYDGNAIKLFADEGCQFPIGFVKRELAKKLVEEYPLSRCVWRFVVAQVSSGGPDLYRGVNIVIEVTGKTTSPAS